MQPLFPHCATQKYLVNFFFFFFFFFFFYIISTYPWEPHAKVQHMFLVVKTSCGCSYDKTTPIAISSERNFPRTSSYSLEGVRACI